MWLWRKVKKNLKAYTFLFWNPVNRVVFLFNGVSCGKKLKSRGKIWVSNGDNGSVVIGDNAVINSGNWTNPIGCGNRCWIQVSGNGKVEISDNVGLSNVAITCAENVKVGNNTMLGSGVKIFDTDFHVLPLDTIDNDKSKIKKSSVLIGQNVFVGANSIILKGTVIEDGAIIGAGSVLAGCKVGKNEVWAGNPARKIR